MSVYAQFFHAVYIFIFFTTTTYGYKPPKAAIVLDATTGKVLYNDHADAPRHPASLTKKMTLYLLFDALRQGRITMQTHFSVSHYANAQMPSKLGITAGNAVSVETIIKSLVTKSANDMAVVAAEGLAGNVSTFVRKMNQKAQELGMRHTTFKNPSGLPDPHQWTTARDMVTLGQALLKHFPQYWRYFSLKHFHHKGKAYRNHNTLLHTYPGMDGIKTGLTNASGFNVSTSAVRHTASGKPIRLFVVVMGGHTRNGRDSRVATLLNRYFNQLGALYNKNGKPDHNYVEANDADELVEATTDPVSSQSTGTREAIAEQIDLTSVNEAIDDNDATGRLEALVYKQSQNRIGNLASDPTQAATDDTTSTQQTTDIQTPEEAAKTTAPIIRRVSLHAQENTVPSLISTQTETVKPTKYEKKKQAHKKRLKKMTKAKRHKTKKGKANKHQPIV